MMLDILVTIASVVVVGKAHKPTLFNDKVINDEETQSLMQVAGIKSYVFKNHDIYEKKQVQELLEKVKREYNHLWVRGTFNLEPTDNHKFNPEDWRVDHVKFNTMEYFAYPAGTMQFSPEEFNIM